MPAKHDFFNVHFNSPKHLISITYTFVGLFFPQKTFGQFNLIERRIIAEKTIKMVE